MFRALKELFPFGKRPGATTVSPEVQEMLKTDELIWEIATDPNIPSEERAERIKALMEEK